MNLELLLPVALLAGFFGGGHCLGMCGPIVVMFESAGGVNGMSLANRLGYNAGRGIFYAALGTAAGAAGTILTRVAGIESGLSLLRMAAAALVVVLGINLLFNVQLLRLLESGGGILWRKLSPLARHVLPMTSLPRAIATGILWGALPCGLVYSAVAMAATTGSGPAGALVMLVFWLGTLPALLFAGASAKQLNRWAKRPLLRRVTGATLIAVGLFALAMPYLHMNGHGGANAHEAHTAASHQRLSVALTPG